MPRKQLSLEKGLLEASRALSRQAFDREKSELAVEKATNLASSNEVVISIRKKVFDGTLVVRICSADQFTSEFDRDKYVPQLAGDHDNSVAM